MKNSSLCQLLTKINEIKLEGRVSKELKEELEEIYDGLVEYKQKVDESKEKNSKVIFSTDGNIIYFDGIYFMYFEDKRFDFKEEELEKFEQILKEI